jgi:hypothetical protein
MPAPRAVIEAFLLRARRVQAHSLIRDHADLMQKLQRGEVKLTATRNETTGESSHRIRVEYPSEEAMESLASRVRPLILRGEPIYYDKVLDALERLVGAGRLDEEIDLSWWRNAWNEVTDANLGAQAYMVSTSRGNITDRKLMFAWLYGDVVHAKSPRSPVIHDLGINERYYAAAPLIARICDLVTYTKDMLDALREKGLYQIDPAILSEAVAVSETNMDRAVKAYTSDVGVPVPSDLSEDLDPDIWQPVDVLFEESDSEQGDEA